MTIEIEEYEGIKLARIEADTVVMRNAQDAVEILMNASYLGAEGIIIGKSHLVPGFFDLKSGIAGEVLQKFSTYGARLAIVGDFSNPGSKSFQDFIYESNKTGRISFLSSEAEARERLSRQF